MNLFAGDHHFLGFGAFARAAAVRLGELAEPAIDVGLDAAAGGHDGQAAVVGITLGGRHGELIFDDRRARLLGLPRLWRRKTGFAAGKFHPCRIFLRDGGATDCQYQEKRSRNRGSRNVHENSHRTRQGTIRGIRHVDFANFRLGLCAARTYCIKASALGTVVAESGAADGSPRRKTTNKTIIRITETTASTALVYKRTSR